MNNFFTENIDNSGAGACSYNETTININTGYGYGRLYDSVNFHKGNGSRTSKIIIINDPINAGSGSGSAKGCNVVSYHLKIRRMNLNGLYR